MAQPILRGAKFTGSIDLKFISSGNSSNVFEYQIASGAVVEIHFAPDTNQVSTLILSTATALPSPPYTGNEVVIITDRTGVTFTCTPAKSAQLAVGNTPVDVKIINDPLTMGGPKDIDIFEKVNVITVSDPLNP